jgi:hypothetical protein
MIYETSEPITLMSSIQSLSLHDIDNTNVNTIWNLLSQLPRLSRISLHQSTLNFHKLSNCVLLPNILALDLSSTSISDRGLKVVLCTTQNVMELNVSNCPNLTSLTFTFVSGLLNLKILRACYLTSCHFDINVENCLLKIGSKLTVLDLSGVKHIKTNIIGNCCADLKELSLNGCVFSTPELIENVCDDHLSKSLIQYCRQLKKLSMTQMTFENADDNIVILQRIFSGENHITHLTMTSSREKESFFKALIKNFEFLDLVSLNLSGSEGVTMKLIINMLQLFPNLFELTLRKCNLIRSEKDELKRFVNKAKIDLKLVLD